MDIAKRMVIVFIVVVLITVGMTLGIAFAEWVLIPISRACGIII